MRQRRVAVATLLAPFALLLALAPSALYIDHWVDIFTQEHHVVEVTPHSKQDSHGPDDAVTHNSHCHGSEGCSDASLTAGIGGTTLEIQSGNAGMLSVLLSDIAARLEEFLDSPLTEPPRV